MSDDLAARIAEADDEVRRQAARDVHDGPQQRLVTATIHLQLAKRVWDDDPGRARGLVADALGDVQDALAALRGIASALHPAVLTTHGLGAALIALADGLDVPVDVVDRLAGRRLPSGLERTLYVVAAEALLAAAGPGRVELSGDASSVAVDIAVPGAAIGPRGADRLAAAGARAEADGDRGVRVEAPLRP